MRRRCVTAVLAVTLVATGCGATDDAGSPPASTTIVSTTVTTTQPTVTSTATEVGDPAESTTTSPLPGVPLPDDPECIGLGPAPSEPVLTFNASLHVWAVRDDGSIVCLVERAPDRTGASMTWSPPGDKLLMDGGDVFDADGSQRHLGLAGDGELLGWTWPTGRRVLTSDGPTLTKHEADGSGSSDATIADDHSVLAYHPDGIHIAVFGTTQQSFVEVDEEGNETVEVFPRTGLFIARNNEPEPQLLVDPVGASITDVVFSEDGTRLSFVADHDGEFHLHSFNLPDMVSTEGELTILTALQEDADLLDPQVESGVPLGDLTVDPADPWRIMFTEGVSDVGLRTKLHDFASGTTVDIAPDLDAAPVGFLGATTVALKSDDGDLWIVDLVADDRTLIGRPAAVDVRDAAPELAFSLVDITIRGFA